MPVKICSRCNKEKDIECFGIRKNRNNRPESHCKQCSAERSGKYYESNVDACKKRSRLYHQKTNYSKIYLDRNRALLNEKTKKWQKKNRHKINKYEKGRYYNDENYNISKKLRVRFFKALERGSKKSSIIHLIGCSISDFRTHLESKFTDGMNWDVFMIGKIHIDHIKPLARFDMRDPEQQKVAWHYTNLQPLWEVDNLIKNSKYDDQENI